MGKSFPPSIGGSNNNNNNSNNNNNGNNKVNNVENGGELSLRPLGKAKLSGGIVSRFAVATERTAKSFLSFRSLARLDNGGVSIRHILCLCPAE